MTAVRGIPQEILQFFQSPGGHSLIVKGSAGTGKTTFALQITEEMGDVARSYYMSIRVSDASLYNQFPWLRARIEETSSRIAGRHFSKTLGQEPIHREGEADVSLEVRLKGTRRPREGLAAGGKLDRTELLKLEGRVEMGEEGDETYDKMGEGRVEDGSLVFNLGSDLPEIDLAYDVVEQNLPERTILLIDSIDALSERYGIHASKLMNTLQKDLVETSLANVVYVVESSGETHLDYLGDGVLSFRSLEHVGRRLRAMTIEKLRGTEIHQHRYLYTLNGGRLQAFPSRVESPRGKPAKWTPIPDPGKNAVSTGSEALDALTGGMLRGRVVAFEIAPSVPTEYIDALRTALICNFAAQGRGVAHVPPKKGTGEFLRELLRPYLSEEALDRHVRVFESTPLGSLEGTRGALHMEGANVDTDLKWSNVEYNLPKSAKPFLSLMAFDTLESIHGDKVLEEMSGHLTAIRRSGDILVGISTPSSASTQKLASLAQSHVIIENLDGSIVLYGAKPYTGLFSLRFDSATGVPQAVLTPIV